MDSLGNGLARLVSILFHPVPVMAVATVVAARGAAAPDGLLWQALAAVAVAAAAVMLYSARQARSGRWAHIDASNRHERSQLNRFACWLLLGLAVLLAVGGAHRAIVLAIALSGLVVLAGHVLRRRLKSSLHMAFAMFAACIVWPQALAAAVLLAGAAALAWSRLALGRHTRAEVLSGAAIGLAAGLLMQLFGAR